MWMLPFFFFRVSSWRLVMHKMGGIGAFHCSLKEFIGCINKQPEVEKTSGQSGDIKAICLSQTTRQDDKALRRVFGSNQGGPSKWVICVL